MGRIKSIEIDNFKSYLGNHVVGPFDQNFTAVIGPNGAGKSNLMDAVSFVLGVHSKDLRGGVLQDLIYKMEGHDRPTAASVSLVFDTEDDEANSDAIDSDIVFTRRVTMRGASSYSVNGTQVSVKDYVEQLGRLGVVVKAKNFLVFQGDVTSIANQSPADLCKFFERISGSEECKAEFDSLNVHKGAAERRLEDLVQQRKAIAQEKKIIEKQKREAEEFHKKKAQHGEQRQQLVLWQLNHAVHRHKEAQAQQQTSEGSREDLQAKIDALGDALKGTSVELGNAKKTLLKQTKAVQVGEHEVTARRLKASEAQKQVAATTKEMAHDSKLQQSLQKKGQEQEAKLEELKAHVAAVEEEREALDLELLKDAADDSSSKLNLSAAELAEYHELKAKATQRSASHMQKAADVAERLARLRKKLEEVERETGDLHAQRKVDLDEIESNRKTSAVARERLAEDEKHLASVSDAIAATKDKLRENGARYTAVIGNIAATNEKLSALMDTRASSSHEEKKQRNLELLQRQFRGVCGRLADLVKPIQRKYNLAVSTALSKNMDSIVVETAATVNEISQFLSSNRAMLRETLLPLDVLDPPQTKERLRQLGSSRKLVVDVMTFDPKFKSAVELACANVVLCETLNDARRLRFQEKVECKVVTIDGSTISMANNMSGGQPNAAAAWARRWDAKESEQFKNELRQLMAERLEIEKEGYMVDSDGRSGGGSTSSSSSSSSSSAGGGSRGSRRGGSGQTASAGTASRELEAKEAQRLNLVSKIKGLQDFAAKHEVSVAQGRKRVTTVDEEIKKKVPEKQSTQAQIAEVEATAKSLEDKVATIGRQVFKDFSARLGIDDIHNFQERVEARLKQQAHRRQSIQENMSKSTNSIKYDESKLADTRKALQRAADQVTSHERKLRSLEVTGKSAVEQLQESENKLQAAKAKEAGAAAELKEKQDAAKAQRAARDKLVRQHEELAERATVAVERAELLQTEMHEILQRAQVDGVHVPTIGERGGRADSSESGTEAGASSSSATSGSQDDLGRLNSTARSKQRAAIERVNFEELEDQDIIADRGEYDTRRAQWAAQVNALAAELDDMQPNLRAAELYADVLSRIRNSDVDYTAAKDEVARLTEAFEKVRTDRRNAFMKAFNHVSSAINGVYEELTKDAAFPHGGNASLSLDGPALDPFLGGVKYIASPPAKRFRQIERLSGGEQTIAALALLFSVHSFRPSPFYVMDEIDAALDNANIKKVADYIKKKSKDFQCLVISLKDLFYSEADALVGIYRDRELDCSKSLTFDLSQYQHRE